MEEMPYTIIVDGSGAVTERRMANHAIGTLLNSTVTVLSNTVSAGKRTVVVSRSALGPSSEYANFTVQQSEMKVPFISAVGSTSSLSYHKNKTASTLAMWPSKGQPVCLCDKPAAAYGHATGTIKYLPTGEEFGFINYCMPEPRESVLAQRNPTCDVVRRRRSTKHKAQQQPPQQPHHSTLRLWLHVLLAVLRLSVCLQRAYVGGLQVCKHMWSLLDSDQQKDPRVQKWKDTPLTYYQKYRFYFQEYTADHHIVSVPRQGWVSQPPTAAN